MKRTNVIIDEKKVAQAKRIFDLQSTKDVLEFALTEILKMHDRKAILNLQGKIKLDLDLELTRKTR